jgi:hypothetical protein
MVAVSHVIVAVVAWLIGLGVYVLALEVAWQQHMSWLSLLSLAQSSAVAWAFAYPCVYIPVLGRVAPGCRSPGAVYRIAARCNTTRPGRCDSRLAQRCALGSAAWLSVGLVSLRILYFSRG